MKLKLVASILVSIKNAYYALSIDNKIDALELL